MGTHSDGPVQREDIKLLDRWLAKHGIHSLVLGEPLPCTDQAKTGDGTSCGFIAANTSRSSFVPFQVLDA